MPIYFDPYINCLIHLFYPDINLPYTFSSIYSLSRHVFLNPDIYCFCFLHIFLSIYLLFFTSVFIKIFSVPYIGFYSDIHCSLHAYSSKYLLVPTPVLSRYAFFSTHVFIQIFNVHSICFIQIINIVNM